MIGQNMLLVVVVIFMGMGRSGIGHVVMAACDEEEEDRDFELSETSRVWLFPLTENMQKKAIE